MSWYTGRTVVLSLLLGSSTFGTGPTAEELLPRLDSPRLRFHTGRVVNNEPEVSLEHPDLPGEPSKWRVTQWKKHQYLLPHQMLYGSDLPKDLRLGDALYSWYTASGETSLSIFKDRDQFVYQLFGRAGWLDQAGGSNVFLSAQVEGSNVDFDRQLDYELTAKISHAYIRYDNADAQRSGAVLAQAFIGFRIEFRDPATESITPVALQIHLTSSRDRQPDYRSCRRRSVGDRAQVTYNHLLPGDPALPFKTELSAPHTIKYNLNRYVCDLVSRDIACRTQNGILQDRFLWPESAKYLRNWRIVSNFLGIETQSTDLRSSSQTQSSQGEVQMGLQVSGVRLTRRGQSNASLGSCPVLNGT